MTIYLSRSSFPHFVYKGYSMDTSQKFLIFRPLIFWRTTTTGLVELNCKTSSKWGMKVMNIHCMLNDASVLEFTSWYQNFQTSSWVSSHPIAIGKPSNLPNYQQAGNNSLLLVEFRLESHSGTISKLQQLGFIDKYIVFRINSFSLAFISGTFAFYSNSPLVHSINDIGKSQLELLLITDIR